MATSGAPRDLMDFAGKVVLVTGGAMGIGHAVAEAFAERGAKLALADCDARIPEIAAALGASHKGYVMDVSDESAVTATVKQAEADFGLIDILVNNAGVGPLAPAESFPTAEWDRTVAINLKGYFLMARAVAPGMLARGSGRIVNIASQAAFLGSTSGHLPYDASKGALVSMTRAIAREVAREGINVNAVAPGMVMTGMVAKIWEERKEKYLARIPLDRIGQPGEIANVVVFLASDAAGYMTGTTVDVSGGLLMR